MTLALYGKSRRRQGGLILAGFVALMIAIIGGVASIQNALAHHPDLRVTRTCDEVTVHFDYVGPNERTYTIFTRANGGASWTQVASFQQSGVVQDVYPAITHALPTTQQYRVVISSGESDEVNLANYAENCTKIIVKKVTIGDPGTSEFSASINGPGDANDLGSTAFSVGDPIVHDIDIQSNNQDFNVTEGSLSGGWILKGKKVLNGDADCESGSWTTVSGTSSSDRTQFINDMDPGDVRTVCFLNELPGPKVTVDKSRSSGGPHSVGSSFDFRIDIDVANGPTTAPVVLTDNVPAHFTVNYPLSVDAGLDCSASSGNNISCTLASGAASGKFEVDINVTVAATAQCGDVKNVASITGTNVDGPGSSTTDEDDTEVEIKCRWLEVCKVMDGNGNGVTDSGEFTLEVTGQDSLFATVSESGDTSDCKSYEITDGATVTITETPTSIGWTNFEGYPLIELYPGANPGGPLNEVTVTLGDESCGVAKGVENPGSGDPDCKVTFRNKKGLPVPTISIAKADSGDGTYGAGDTFNWVLTLTSANGTFNGTVTDNVPAAFEITGAITDDAGSEISCSNVGNAVSCTLTNFNNASSTITIPVKVLGSVTTCGVINNSATITGLPQGTQGTHSAEHGVDVTGADCLEIEKEFVQIVGDEASWTVEVKNTGTSDAWVYFADQSSHNIIDIILPTGGNAECNPAPALPVDYVPCNLEVPAGQTRTFTFITAVPEATCEGIQIWNEIDYAKFYGSGEEWPAIEIKGTNPVTHTIEGDPELCDREVIIDKFFTNLGNYELQEGDWPTFEPVPDIDGFDFATDCSILPNGLNGHRAWVCTVPADWDGDFEEVIDETKWVKVDLANCVSTAPDSPTGQAQERDIERFPFCNEPVTRVIVNKTFAGEFAGDPDFTFSSNLPGGVNNAPGANNTTTEVYDEAPVAPGSYSVTEDQFLSEAEGCFGDEAAGYATYYDIVKNGATIASGVEAETANFTVAPGDTVIVTFVNANCDILGDPQIVIQKFNDPAGNRTGTQPVGGFQVRVLNNGVEIPLSPFTLDNTGFLFIPGLNPGTVEVFELNPNTGGWVMTGSKTDLGDNGSAEFSVGGQPAVQNIAFGEKIRFNLYNQPRVNIVVSKTIFNNANPAGANGGSGWTFTLNGCGIGPDQKTTDASGTVSWTNLPPAVGCSYTVTETAKAGWVADQISKSTSPDEPGETATLGFVNRQIEGCTNIDNCDQPEDPTPTPETPTNTPETDETPTNTPEPDETPTEDLDDDVAGEKTPGPGDQATPIAPDTGAGISGTTSAGMNVLLIIAGLIAISGGLSFIALGRKKS